MKLPEKPPTILNNEYKLADILDELKSLGKFGSFVDINESKYPYWDKWKYTAKEWNFDPKKLWSAVQSSRYGYRFYFKSLPACKLVSPSVVQQYLHEFDMNLGGNIQGNGIIPSEEKDRYLISSLMEEAIASSQLEGAVTTRKVAKEMLESNRKPRTTSEQMILNNYEGMKWIADNKHLRFTPENIRHIHSIITKNTLPHASEEGSFRTDNEVRVVDVQTGTTIYTPPPHDQLNKMIEEYCSFANDENKQSFFIHPISKAITLHFLMGYIHPFSDGNGRTARTIFYWYLLKKGYWLIEFMSVSRIILNSKAQYARAYLHTEIDNNDLTYFVIYNLKCLSAALVDLKKYIERKTEEKKNVLQLLRNTSFNDRQIVILHELIKDPSAYFSVQQVQTKFNVSNQTARNDLDGLTAAKLMESRKSGKKIQFFAVADFLKKVTKGKK
jgi:Fic family protein